MSVARRDFFRFLGGSAAGLVFTPVPWKVLDDVAIWSQNWSWVPKPPRGEVTARYTTCSLCAAGCGMRVRCVGGHPVQLAGVAGHPLSSGALCPLGIAAHHLPYHPARLTQCLKSGSTVSADKCIAGIGAAVSAAGSVAVLDCRPGRTVSNAYRRFAAAVPGGSYIVPPVSQTETLDVLASMSDREMQEYAFDLENTRTILSFGTPVLEGWAGPGLLRNRDRFKLIQAEPRQSRTANLADVWLALKPGTEAALALGIAHVLTRENLVDAAAQRLAADYREYLDFVRQYTPERTGQITGLAPHEIRNAARMLASGKPAIAVAGGDPGAGPSGRHEQVAVAGLNILLGSLGSRGGALPRKEAPGLADANAAPALTLDKVPDGAIAVLIIDGEPAIPWPIVKRKLTRERPILVMLAAFRSEWTERADYVLPTPAFAESYEEAASLRTAARASFAVTTPLNQPAAGAIDPADALTRIASALDMNLAGAANTGDLLKQRAASIHKSGRGSVFTYADAKSTPLKEIQSADDFWKMLDEGGIWTDDASTASAPAGNFRLLGEPGSGAAQLAKAVESAGANAEFPLALLPHGASSSVVSPVLTKIYQESGLMDSADVAVMHPETARQFQLLGERNVAIETNCGACTLVLRLDPAVMPGTVEIAVAPGATEFRGSPPQPDGGVLDICGEDNECVWRVTRAKVRKV